MRLNQLREQLISRLAEEVQGRVSEVLVRKALVEAEALAWATQFPLLFLPALAEEKVRNAREWSGRQREVLERQRVLATIL